MAENVIAGDLADIEWSPDGEEATFVVIKGCKTVGIPEENPEYRDRTSLDSPGRSREWGVGLTDTSELTLSCFYSAALYELAMRLQGLRQAGVLPGEAADDGGSGHHGGCLCLQGLREPLGALGRP